MFDHEQFVKRAYRKIFSSKWSYELEEGWEDYNGELNDLIQRNDETSSWSEIVYDCLE